MTAATALETIESAHDVVVSSESAGGDLAIDLLITVKAQALPSACAAVLFSPMTAFVGAEHQPSSR